MANTIQIRRGSKASLPTLAQGELAFCTDTDELYIGNGVSNVLVNGGGSGSSLSGTGDCTVDIDSDNSQTTAVFKITKHGGGTTLASFDEVGNLTIAGTLTEAGLTSSGQGPLTTSQVWARILMG